MFKALTKAVLGAALLPVDAVADVCTLGGVITDRPRTYTGERARDILDNLKRATEPDR